MMDAAERGVCLVKMREAAHRFYGAAVNSGNHAFIEFTGLMTEYIKLCAEAHDRGEDFTELNVHAGRHLDVSHHHLAYLNEKMECIYGLKLEPAQQREGGA